MVSRRPEYTAEEFEHDTVVGLAGVYETTPEEMRRWIGVVQPCECGDSACRGWQMGPAWQVEVEP